MWRFRGDCVDEMRRKPDRYIQRQISVTERRKNGGKKEHAAERLLIFERFVAAACFWGGKKKYVLNRTDCVCMCEASGSKKMCKNHLKRQIGVKTDVMWHVTLFQVPSCIAEKAAHTTVAPQYNRCIISLQKTDGLC